MRAFGGPRPREEIRRATKLNCLSSPWGVDRRGPRGLKHAHVRRKGVQLSMKEVASIWILCVDDSR